MKLRPHTAVRHGGEQKRPERPVMDWSAVFIFTLQTRGMDSYLLRSRGYAAEMQCGSHRPPMSRTQGHWHADTGHSLKQQSLGPAGAMLI